MRKQINNCCEDVWLIDNLLAVLSDWTLLLESEHE